MTPNQNIHFLLQGLELLGSLDRETYTAAADGRSSIGAHLRHVVDYYRCFFGGLASGRVDYDARARDPRIETDPRRGAAALQDLVERFRELPREDRQLVLEVKVDTDDDDVDVWSRSTVARELQFLVSHTVHHYALIAMLLRQQGVDPGPAFGVAPSTLKYRKSLACAR